jgi:3-deoxy-D-manno-octulosonic-acid transferase
MFRYFYWVLSVLVYLLALPLMLIKMRKPRYKERIPATFFLKNNPPLPSDMIWFHGNSLGEIKGLSAITEVFDRAYLAITVVTNTGKIQASQMADHFRYLPYELFLPFWVRKQKMLIVTEAELKFMLFFAAKRKGIQRIIMINARVNEKRYERYKKFAWYYRRIFALIDKVYAQREIDQKRLAEFGASNIEVIGNIKLSNLPQATKVLSKPDAFMIVAASTHDTDVYEEKLILEAWDRSQGMLVIVPRHPERFDEVDTLIKAYLKDKSLTYHRYSQREDFESDVVLVDRMGELINIYAISDLVILGGAFCTTEGGHNPIEAAYFDNILISGDLMYHQYALFDNCNDYYLVTKEELPTYLQMAQAGQLKKASVIPAGDVSPIISEIQEVIEKGKACK